MAEPGEDLPPKEPKFTFGFVPPRTPTFAVGGAFGGSSPDGTVVVVHLFVEHYPLPNYTLHDTEIVEGRKRVHLEARERVTQFDITREVQATLVIPPDVARALARFLVGHADDADGRRGG